MTTIGSEGVAQALSEQEADAARQQLKGATVSGAAVNMAAQLIRFVLLFAYQIAIAHLLLPADFGLVAMTAPVIAFVQLFSDLGLSSATVQHPDINQGQLSFLFWINVGMGAGLAVLIGLAAPLVGWFYGDPRVVDITRAAGAMLLLGGLYSQQMALLNRWMRFRAVALVELSSFAIGAAAGIGSALLGLSYWAIVVNQAATSLSALVIAWAVCGWRPGRPGPRADMRVLFRFGANLTGFSIVNFFARNMDKVLLGRVWGELSLGLYDRAFKLVLLPFNQIAYPFTRVALPLLSRSQDEPDFYRNAYRRLLESVLLLSYPGLVFALATHQSLIEHVLGRRWAAIGPIFGILVLDAFVAPIASSMGWLFVSQGRTREMRDYGIITSLLFVCCFAAGLHWGGVGVACGYVVAGMIEITLLWRVATRRGPMRGMSFLSIIHPFLAGGVAAACVIEGLLHLMAPGWTTLGVCAVASYAAFYAAMAALSGGRRILRGMIEQGWRMLPARRARRLRESLG